ncbi:MAG TPA: phosphatidate cytidylyltransferase [Rickettsiales bacterium]|nr:phosphatidate cytidylyltransferase [Rickettsiales bacterium]
MLKFLYILKDLANIFVKRIAAIDVQDKNLKQRIISSLIMIPIAIYAIYVSKNLFLFLAIAIAILMSYEWLEIIKNSREEKKWKVAGFFYIAIPIYAVIRLRFISSDIVFWMFAIIWTTDICAYFIGKIYGGKKLAPSISPGKTWAGFYGAIIGSAIIGFLSSFMFLGTVLFFVIISVLLSVVEQLSDLLESKFKRSFGVKDSGNIIPGHGGVLDRLDGMMLVAPFLLMLVEIFSRQFGV